MNKNDYKFLTYSSTKNIEYVSCDCKLTKNRYHYFKNNIVLSHIFNFAKVCSYIIG